MRDHSPTSLSHARRLRREMTLPERLLWQRLRGQPMGVKFRKQHPLGDFVIDFYCAAARVAIEIDGEAHNRGDRPERDQQRDAVLSAMGVKVVRYSAADVLRDVDAAADSIIRTCAAPPPPTSLRSATSPEGGGIETALLIPPPLGEVAAAKPMTVGGQQSTRPQDARHMAAAIALSQRGQGRTAPNPNVGCLIVSPAFAEARGDRVIAQGWTQPTGRPHAEAMALAQAGNAARGATAYVTLEPCAHSSARGPACTDSLIAAGIARVVVATRDPDPRTNGQGLARLAAAGIAVTEGVLAAEARAAMAGWWTRTTHHRAHVTLKLATSLDGCIALASAVACDGGSQKKRWESRWITSEPARRHTHLLRAQCDAILVGRGTWDADQPKLDVRLPGLEDRSPRRIVLSNASPLGGGGPAQPGRWGADNALPPPSGLRPATSPDGGGVGTGLLTPPPSGGAAGVAKQQLAERSRDGGGSPDPIIVASPTEATHLPNITTLLVEGGAQTATAFLRANLVDRVILYRAPILIGSGKASLADIGLTDLSAAHGQWHLTDARTLGPDRMEIYTRT